MYLPNFLDGFDRLVAFDAETTGTLLKTMKGVLERRINDIVGLTLCKEVKVVFESLRGSVDDGREGGLRKGGEVAVLSAFADLPYRRWARSTRRPRRPSLSLCQIHGIFVRYPVRCPFPNVLSRDLDALNRRKAKPTVIGTLKAGPFIAFQDQIGLIGEENHCCRDIAA
jgi:hypothetical protein